MKRHLLFIALLSLPLVACKKYKNKEVYANVPVYMDYETLRSSFEFQQGAAPINGSGNIFLHNQYILLSEAYRGIHIIDNSSPQNPVQIGFISIPGNTQIAVKNDLLYANSYIDLLTIDISSVTDPKLICRYEDVLSYDMPPIQESYPVADIYKDRGVVIDWKIEKTKEVSGFMKKCFVADCEDCDKEEMEVKIATGGSVNLGASRSKFAIKADYLYILDGGDIKSFSIAGGDCPDYKSKKRTWREPETLISDDQNLFMGTTTGMVIYDVSNPDQPDEISEVEHITSCDPVVVQGDYAYLTIRSSSECGGDQNEVQVIDISNRNWPKFKSSGDLMEPYGLGIDGNLLFVCDGIYGIKVYDASDPVDAPDNLIKTFHGITALDVIPYNGVAIVITENSIAQYDYSDPENLILLSVLDF